MYAIDGAYHPIQELVLASTNAARQTSQSAFMYVMPKLWDITVFQSTNNPGLWLLSKATDLGL